MNLRSTSTACSRVQGHSANLKSVYHLGCKCKAPQKRRRGFREVGWAVFCKKTKKHNKEMTVQSEASHVESLTGGVQI